MVTLASPISHVHQSFRHILPRIELHARIFFRQVRCKFYRDDATAEMVALAWKWHVGMAARGKDAAAFPSAVATLAARAVKAGRRICGQEKARDVLSVRAQCRHRFTVRSLPTTSTLESTPLLDALVDNKQTPIPEQVSFRCDFPRWRETRSPRDRRIIDDLMVGESTQTVARTFSLSPGRISQLRREFKEDWDRFTDVLPPRLRIASRSPKAGHRRVAA